MRERPTGPVAAAPGRRKTALWVAVLAAYRGGLLNRIVDAAGSLDAALDLDAATVRDIVRPRRGRREAPGAEEPAFRRVLTAGPDRLDPALIAGPAVTWDDDAYPCGLRQVRDAPPALFLGGRVGHGLRALGVSPAVAVVGTRGPSAYGREMASQIARDLTRAGVLVVSGLAMGIDATAQQAAVDARSAAATGDAPERLSTVAVMGCGVRLACPRENEPLWERIRETGLIVSEFPGTIPANRWRFPCRNRIIAGLARAVVVVEGGSRSGSLITAGFALQLGRDVLAVPGEASRKLSAGPHDLLRQGAHLCESAADVLDVIGLRDAGWSTHRVYGAPVEGPLGVLVGQLDGGERTIDELAAALGTGAAETAALVASLEVGGVVARVPGGRYRLRRD